MMYENTVCITIMISIIGRNAQNSRLVFFLSVMDFVSKFDIRTVQQPIRAHYNLKNDIFIYNLVKDILEHFP